MDYNGPESWALEEPDNSESCARLTQSDTASSSTKTIFTTVIENSSTTSASSGTFGSLPLVKCYLALLAFPIADACGLTQTKVIQIGQISYRFVVMNKLEGAISFSWHNQIFMAQSDFHGLNHSKLDGYTHTLYPDLSNCRTGASEVLKTEKMEVRRLLWLLAYLLNIPGNTSELEENYYNTYLTSIPIFISTNVTSLIFYRNDISTIRKSDFNDQFPYLHHIDLNVNRITAIESGCFKGTILRSIHLNQNQLTMFPHFNEVKSTLEKITIRENAIVKLSREDVAYLSRISELDLRVNPIVHLPDFSKLLPSLAVLKIETIELECCWKNAWLKQTASSLFIFMDIQPCKSPSKWNTTDWHQITDDMLLQQPCNDVPDQALLIPGYSFLRRDRRTQGGGVALYYRSSLGLRCLTSLETQDYEVIWFQASTREHDIIGCAAYWPPGSDLDITQHLQHAFDEVSIEFNTIVLLAGDLNAHHPDLSESISTNTAAASSKDLQL
ncbi:hypothetical protein CAPTEDRAFT_197199 [Capitella teleta]|uniref:Endonuclease/exonuclease/phosphatase domain-containing protein n=1 Tax=Capitella teleta TaxID=283909 RepID=R7UDB1_CAPTE|nr:hypothetical protein CAPTEDRAFT_197199 [Capitella teleta]|eukprot:ELU03944.1 hypothetical protein CAPTEDRAFT_197199 [Capitella teleta]